jgi:hypothetical protein
VRLVAGSVAELVGARAASVDGLDAELAEADAYWAHIAETWKHVRVAA